MFQIRTEQLQALGASTHDQFVARVADFLARSFPDCKKRTREWLQAVESLVREGEAIGLVAERDLAAMV